jgi:hypothetical protein
VIVLQIHLDRVSAIPSERDAPIPADTDRPSTRTTQRVKIVSGKIHVLWTGGGTNARSMRPILLIFGTLNPLASPTSK